MAPGIALDEGLDRELHAVHGGRWYAIEHRLEPVDVGTDHAHACRQEALVCEQLGELGGGDEASLGDLAVVESVRTVVHDAEHVAHLAGVLVVVVSRGDELEIHRGDTELLGQLAHGGFGVRLADTDDTAGGDVPPSRKQVLVVGAAVDEQVAAAVGDDHGCGAMAKVVASHPAAGHDPDHPAVWVDVLDRFVAWARCHDPGIPSRYDPRHAARRSP